MYQQAQEWLQPSRTQKKNLNRGNLLGQQRYQYTKEYGLILNHQSKISSRTISRRKSSIFFDTIRSYIEKKMEQFNSTRVKFHLRDHHLQIQNWSDDRWIACLVAGGGSKRRYQYCSDHLGSIIYLRALQGHSGGNLIDLTLQDNVLIGPEIFLYIYHVGINFNLYSIISNGLIPGGQNLSRRQSIFFLPVDPRNEDHREPENIDYSVPRHRPIRAKCNWKRHQETVFWIDIDLGIIKEGLKFYQTRSNAIILQGTLPANCIVRAERLKNEEKLYERQYVSPRPPPKISLKHDLNWSKGKDQGSTVEHRPVGKLVQQSLGETLQFGSSKPTQFPKPIEDRTGKPVTQEIVGKLQEELSSSDRLGKPEKKEEQHVRNHDGSGKLDGEERLHKVQEDCHLKNRDDTDKFNLATDDENIDFNISGIPDAAVQRSQNFSIHDLIQRIASHPQQEAVQNDPRTTTIIQCIQRRVKELLSWMQETLRFVRLSTWSRSGHARCVLSIAVQEVYTAHVDIL